MTSELSAAYSGLRSTELHVAYDQHPQLSLGDKPHPGASTTLAKLKTTESMRYMERSVQHCPTLHGPEGDGQIEVDSIYQLVDLLRKCNGARSLVAIDGVDGAGKSSLAAQLAVAFDGTHVEADEFLSGKASTFFDDLDLEGLRRAIDRAPAPVFLSGLCMLRTLQALGRAATLLVYVKRMQRWGWADEDYVVGDAIEETARALGQPVETMVLPLEVRSYHREYAPHRSARIVLLRAE